MSEKSSKILLDKMSSCVDAMHAILRNHRLSAEVQVADINTLCWAMVDLTHKLQSAVGKELYGIDEK